MNTFYLFPFINIIRWFDTKPYSSPSLPPGEISLRCIKKIDFVIGFLWFYYKKNLYSEK
jgi:hypothetical protein